MNVENLIQRGVCVCVRVWAWGGVWSGVTRHKGCLYLLVVGSSGEIVIFSKESDGGSGEMGDKEVHVENILFQLDFKCLR